MNVETKLRKLEAKYREALSGAVVAKARYLARVGDRGATGAQTARLQEQWQELERRRRELAERMARLEAMEYTAIH
jgi:transcription elongation GreA/GreB family factor